MVYDEDLAERVRALMGIDSDVTERRMFGGLAFLIGGNMSVAVSGQGGLMVRVDPDEPESLSGRAHAHPFEMRGRPVDGWLRVDAEGLQTEDELRAWVACGVGYARTLTAKG